MLDNKCFSSIIWATKPAEMILKSMGKRPSEYLNSKIKSKTKLRIMGLQTARSTFAGFLGISQIFAMMFYVLGMQLKNMKTN